MLKTARPLLLTLLICSLWLAEVVPWSHKGALSYAWAGDGGDSSSDGGDSSSDGGDSSSDGGDSSSDGDDSSSDGDDFADDSRGYSDDEDETLLADDRYVDDDEYLLAEDELEEPVAEQAYSDTSEGFVADELLAINPSPAALQRARQLLGAEVIQTSRLSKLGLDVVRLRLGVADAQMAQKVLANQDPGVFELHHLYRLAAQQPGSAAAQPAPCVGALCQAKGLIGWPTDSSRCGRGQRIGIVDTAVQVDHPVLRGARIQTRAWLSNGQTLAHDGHGTAVAALLVGREHAGYAGLVPRARLYAASPFFQSASGQPQADAWGLIQSLEWLAGRGVTVVGLSLTGPPNEVLEAVLQRLHAQGVTVIAAAGNGGRAAPPAFPAAYTHVLAVTAINPSARSYRRANQGPYIQYAMPGVDLPTVTAEGAFLPRSGTSFAVPFLVGMVSQSVSERSIPASRWQSAQGLPLRDLGHPGRDEVFGWGLPQAPIQCQ